MKKLLKTALTIPLTHPNPIAICRTQYHPTMAKLTTQEARVICHPTKMSSHPTRVTQAPVPPTPSHPVLVIP